MRTTASIFVATLAGSIAFATQAQAAPTVVTSPCSNLVIDGNSCTFSGNINGSTNTTADASFLNAQNAYNAYAAMNGFGTITLNFLADTDSGLGGLGTFTGLDQTSGTFTINPGYSIDYFAVKYGDRFTLYNYNGQTTFTTDGQHGLSHLVFFGSQTAVPEPATWAMMLLGFGGIGIAMRRRRGSRGRTLGQIA